MRLMRSHFLTVLMAGTAIALAGCGSKDADASEETLEKGQVVATIDGKDVTVYELNTELQGINIPAGVERKTVEQQALQRILDRKILADIARERGLDKTPDYILQTRRANEEVLVSLLRRDAAGKIPPVTDEDAEKFVAANPGVFQGRKILVVDQIQFPMPANREALKSFQPLKTLDDIEQKLVADGITYRRVPTSLDTLQLPPQLAKQITSLPPGEVFVIPVSGVVTANNVTETRVSPVIGADAVALAKRMIQQERLSKKAKDEFEPLLKEARTKVAYQAGYGPPPAAKGAAAPAPKN